MVDYIIVGSGLAGISFSEHLLENKKSFVVFNSDITNSTKVAGGLFNPIVLKRFTSVWNADAQLEYALRFFEHLQTKFNVQLCFNLPLYRRFFSIEEQNNWFVASDKPNLTKYLSNNLVTVKFQGISSPYGFGEVFNTGYVNTKLVVELYNRFLAENSQLINENFDYSELKIKNDYIEYKNIKSKRIVFAEGFALNQNPYFNYLPLDGTKGELLIIKAEKLDINTIINTSIFILPLGNHLYKVGATYNWNDKTETPTNEGRLELVTKLEEIIECKFEVLEHQAGVRPTVNDRRPLLGVHPQYNNLFVLNGLGTRGVMLGPSMAKDLYNFIENNIELDKTVSIQRYNKYYQC
jgi:glycine oxidase